MTTPSPLSGQRRFTLLIFSALALSSWPSQAVAQTLYINGNSVTHSGGTRSYSNVVVGDSAPNSFYRMEAAARTTTTSIYSGYAPSAEGTISVNGSGTQLASQTAFFGDAGTGTLNVAQGGAATSAQYYFGYRGRSTGVANVTGASSTLTSSDVTYVGYSGQGTLNVENGGQASARFYSVGAQANGTGDVTVSGADSTFQSTHGTFVGAFGRGTLNVKDGGLAYSDRQTYIGNSYFSNADTTVFGRGTVIVAGEQSRLSTRHDTFVGEAGRGELYVQSGGLSEAGSHYLGFSSTGTGFVSVSGPGSTLQSTTLTVVGTAGEGTLVVENGGVAAAPNTYVGRSVGSEGSVSVDGSASRLSTNNLFVGGTELGSGGSGNVLVTNGGTVEVSGTTIVWQQGSVQIGNGGILKNNGVFYTNGGDFDLQAGGTLTGSGAFFNAVTVDDGAIVAPGNSPGTMTFNSGLTLASGGFYDWEILHPLGAAGTGWDQILVNGGLDISATGADRFTINLLSLSDPANQGLLAGFDSSQSYSWSILSFDSFLGFDLGGLMLNWSGFQNQLNGGYFALAQRDNSLYIDYTASTTNPVPEPSSLALLLSAGAFGLMRAGRRRLSSRTEQAA